MYRFKDCQQVFINSKYKLNSSETSSNFSYEIKLQNPNFDHVCLVAACIPKSYYMIDEKHRSFTLREQGVDYKITLQSGNYSFNTLKSELQSLLNEANPSSPTTYVISIASSNMVQDGKITFSVSGNTGFQPSLIFEDNNEFAQILGFEPAQTYNFSSNLLVSPNVVFLQRNESLLIVSNLVKSSLTSFPVLGQVFATNVPDFGFIQWRCPSVPSYCLPLNSHLGVYTFQILNNNEEIVDLNGIDINLTVQFFQFNSADEILRQTLLLQHFESLSSSNK